MNEPHDYKQLLLNAVGIHVYRACVDVHEGKDPKVAYCTMIEEEMDGWQSKVMNLAHARVHVVDGLTTKDLQNSLDMTLQGAGNVLLSLWNMGLLWRKQRNIPTVGGREWVYYAWDVKRTP